MNIAMHDVSAGESPANIQECRKLDAFDGEGGKTIDGWTENFEEVM